MNRYFADAHGTEISDAKGIQQEMHEADEALYGAAPDLREALRDLMARFALDTPEDCAEVSALLGMEDEGALWDAAEKAQAALDKADGKK